MTLAINPTARPASLDVAKVGFGIPSLIASMVADAVLWAQLGLVSTMMFLGIALQQSPVLIAGESMAPGMVPGDVVVLEKPRAEEDLTGWATTYETERGPVTHRVIGVKDDGLVTQGDANRSADSVIMDRADIIGVVRHVVPFVGRPVTWLRAGNWLPLAAWVGVTVAAVAIKTSTRDTWDEDAKTRGPAVEGHHAFTAALDTPVLYGEDIAAEDFQHHAFAPALQAHGASDLIPAPDEIIELPKQGTETSFPAMTTLVLRNERDWSSIR